MAYTPPAPLIKGYRYDWSSLEISVGENRYENSFSSVDYEKKRERGAMRGKRPGKAGRTRGKETCTFSAEMHKEDFEDFKSWLADQIDNDVDTYRDVPFDFVCSYSEVSGVVTDTIVGCLVDSVKNGSKRDSNDPTMVTLTFDVMNIIENGEE